MKKPTLSVIMPNYNHARFLPDALESVLGQSYPPSEVIVLDDGSTDGSVEIIERFARREPVIRFIRNEQNMGLMYSMEKLLHLATGDYLMGVACDDKLLPGMFEACMPLLAAHPEAGLCSTLSRIMDESGADLGVLPLTIVTDTPAYLPRAEVRRLLGKFGSWMQGNTVIYRRQALVDAGGFLPELRSYTDGFIHQVIGLTHGVCFVPEPLTVWRKMQTTYSATMMADASSMLEIMSHAKELMRSRYRDLFPEDYVRAWWSQVLFDVGREVRHRRSAREREFLRQLQALDAGGGVLGRLTLETVKGASRLEAALALCHLAVAHFPRHSVRRQLHRMVRGRSR